MSLYSPAQETGCEISWCITYFCTLIFFFLSLNWKLKKHAACRQAHSSQYVCALMLRDGTAVENRCGCTDHNVSHFSGCNCQRRHARELPPTPALTKLFPGCQGVWRGRDLLLLCHAESLQGTKRAEGRVFFPAFYLIRLNSAGCTSLVQSVYGGEERSGKWRSVSGLRQSFQTTRPLRATEWTRSKYSQTLGQWHAGVCVCV